MSFARVELEFCKDFTDKLTKHPLAIPFLRPVDARLVPDYYQKITRPMDLRTLKENLEQNKYDNSKQWAADALLIWQNAQKYNQKKTILYESAVKLEKKCKKAFERIPKTEAEAWALKVSKINHKIKNLLKEVPPEGSLTSRNIELALKSENENQPVSIE